MHRLFVPCVATATMLLSSCHQPLQRDADVERPTSQADAAAHAVIDDATVSRCVLAYSCGLSHPGLGTSSQTSSIDLATCARTNSSASGPYEAVPTPTPPHADASTSSSKSTKSTLSTEECGRIKALLLAVNEDDARQAQESAQMDSTACSLTLTCAPNAAAKLSVQRQSINGPSRVEQLIRAVMGMAK